MEARPWFAASGALALNALAIAGLIAIAGPKMVRELVRPVQVELIEPPAPQPPKPEIVKPQPPRPEPPTPARVEPPPQAPKRPPPRRVEPVKPRPQPVAPRAQPAAPAPPEPARPPPAPVAAAAPIESPRPSAITAAPAPEGTPVAPKVSEGVPASGAAAGAVDARAAAAPVRTGPRLDASWAGNSPPSYPPMARRMGEEGEVRLDVHVGPDGSVLDVKLKRSSGSRLLDRTAIDTVKKWRFTPATVDGKPVAAWYHDWKWVFRLES